MRCAFADSQNICHYKYPSFRCLEEECEVWNLYNALENECVYLDNHGCIKLNLLSCKGKENCVFYREFFESQDEYLKSRKRE